MNKMLVTILSTFLVSGCATYGGYTPVVDDSIYQRPQQSYQPPPPPQQLYTRQQVLDKKGKPVIDQYGNPVYQQVPVVDQSGQPVYQQTPAPQQQQYYQQQGPVNSAGQDSVECQQIAKNAASTATEAVKGGLVGGLVGAAGGAALGAILGNPGKGAAIGAATGGIGGGSYSGLTADQQYKRVYNNCMRSRGHNVLD